MILEFSRLIMGKYSNIKIHENMSSRSRVVLCGQTDRRADMTKLIAAVQLTCLKDMGVMRIIGLLTMPPEISKYDE